jgi:protein-S-isoprenylcysteine O-methyltransferase Ste14
MDRAVSEARLPQRTVPRLSMARLGDALLAAFWVVMSAGSISEAIERAPHESAVATAHHAVSSLILCLTAVLFIIRRPAQRSTGSWLSRTIAIVGSWLMPALILMPLTWESAWLLMATTTALVVLHVVVFWSLLTLRRSFSIFPEARALVRTGPYGIVRHPLYAIYIVMYPCFLLPRLSVLATAVTVLGIACEVRRARDEEAILGASFPDYAEYAHNTPRFVPRWNARQPARGQS